MIINVTATFVPAVEVQKIQGWELRCHGRQQTQAPLREGIVDFFILEYENKYGHQ